ncbi:MAG: hypothetical protein JWQ18_801 [Conexibacter sp.]|nr:hypothetical protein [Conexibacter sp.]
MIAAILAVVGVGLIVGRRRVARGVIDARATAVRRGSLLNEGRVDREVEAIDNPRAERLELGLVAAVGVLLVVGAVIAAV